MSRRRDSSAQRAGSRDRWLLSYADFITLLFALFVVLFASNYGDNRRIPVVSRAIGSGFRDMGAFPAADRGGSHEGSASSSTVSSTVSTTDEEKAAARRSTSYIEEMLATKRQIESAMGSELRNRELSVRMSPEGFVISLNELGFFDSGEATLRPGAASKIGRMSAVLARNGLTLRIEGHSDNAPIHNSRFRSNWELSASRAMTVLLLLLRDGKIDPARLSVAGYGEYRPVSTNATPEGRALNRRVDLVVMSSVHSR